MMLMEVKSMSSYEDYPINDLLAECRRHNDEAFDELVRRYTPMLRSVVSGFCSASFDFGELFSEACVALHIAAQRFDTQQSDVTFGLYARICVRNRIVDLLRPREREIDIAECDVDLVGEDESALTGLVERERFESLLKSCRDLLSDYEYNVLMLHIQGYKTAAIADMLSRTAKSVDNAKARVFRRLREQVGSIDN